MLDAPCVALPRVEDVVHTLCQAVVTDPSLRVRGPQQEYRCKATYSLTPRLVTSPLARPAVNALAEAVADFVSQRSVMPSIAPNFFFEVMGKVSRVGGMLIKLTIVNRTIPASLAPKVRAACPSFDTTTVDTADAAPRTLFDAWYDSTERRALCGFLQQRFPSLVAVVAHVCRHLPELQKEEANMAQEQSGSHGSPRKAAVRKPDKGCDYVGLLTNGATTITEYTPNQRPFQLSADSFCEVNQPMEDAIFDSIRCFLRLDEDGAANTASAAARDAFITGRDVNSVVKTFEQFYRSVACVTSCPSVFSDARMNGITQCEFSHKDEIFRPLSAFHQAGVPGDTHGVASPRQERHALLTAGRHGLHPRTSKMLAAMAASPHHGALSDVIYVSCNVHSMARDLHILKTALRVVHARTFDFFPGTDYVMTVLHLQPIQSLFRLLVIPIGMPAAGKSSAGRALVSFFAGHAHTTETARTVATSGKPTKKRKTESTTAPFVPRSYCAVEENVTIAHFERDAAFHALRTSGTSLKQSRRALHETLLAVLHPPKFGGVDRNDDDPVTSLTQYFSRVASSSGSDDELPFQLATVARHVVYLDSTNGDLDARALYASTFRTETQPHNGRAATPDVTSACAGVLELAFNVDSPMTEDAIVRRVGARPHHPGFPQDVAAQRRKLAAIGTVMFAEQQASTVAPGASRLTVDSATDGLEYFTDRQVLLAVGAHLWFSAPHAQHLFRTAVPLVRDTLVK